MQIFSSFESSAAGMPNQLTAAATGAELEHLLLENIRDYAIYALDREGRISSWNAGAARMKGYSAGEVLGKPVSLFYPPEVRESSGDLLGKAAREGSVETEGWRLRADGSRFWAHVLISAIRSCSGELLGFAKITQDRTALRQAEMVAHAAEREVGMEKAARTAAEELHAQYRLLFQSNPQPMLILDLESRRYLDANAAALQQYGYTLEEFQQLGLEDLRSPGDGLPTHESVEHHGVWRHRRKDGSPLEVEIVSNDLVYLGRPARLVLVRDLTEELRLRRESQESLERYALVGKATQDPVWDWDVASGQLVWNDAVRRTFGYTSEEVVDRLEWWSERIHPEERAEVLESLEIAVHGAETSWSRTYRFLRGDGEYADVLDRGFIVRDAEGSPLRMIGSLIDLTERRRIVEQRTLLAQIGEALNSAQEEDGALEAVAALAIPRLADGLLVDVVDGEGSPRRAVAAHRNPEKQRLLQLLHERFPPTPGSPQPAARAMETGREVLLEEISDETLVGMARGPEHLELMRALAGRSSLCVPLVLQGRVLGAVTLVHCGSDRRFTAGDTELAREVARRLALFLDRERLVVRLRRELAERHHAEEELRKSHDLLHAIIEGTTDAVFVKDTAGRYLSINTAGARFLGLPVDRILGRDDSDLWDEDSGRSLMEQDRLTMAGPGPRTSQEILRQDGRTRVFMATKGPLRDSAGRLIGLFGVSRDITKLKDTEEELRRRTLLLTERVAEIRCLMQVSSRLYEAGEHVEQALPDLLRLLPDGLRLPEATGVRLRLGDKVTETPHFHPSPLSLTVSVGLLGTLTISRLPTWTEPFTDEERSLLHSVAERLADALERAEALRENRLLQENLERRIMERTAELASANAELEAFAYSVSHDLRTPLRSMDGFSQALLEDYGDSLDETGRDYLNRIRKASQRMGDLIDDMLVLSRVNRCELALAPLDLSAMAAEILAELRKAHPERPVHLQVAPGLQGVGDARLVRIALTNLLQNAWKFTGPTALPRIEFGTTGVDGRPVFLVRDNGVGFDMAHAGKLFGAFQRLHAFHEFPGTGIGLATAQRVVHRHGGRIWAQARPGEGATFYFHLGAER